MPDAALRAGGRSGAQRQFPLFRRMQGVRGRRQRACLRPRVDARGHDELLAADDHLEQHDGHLGAGAQPLRLYGFADRRQLLYLFAGSDDTNWPGGHFSCDLQRQRVRQPSVGLDAGTRNLCNQQWSVLHSAGALGVNMGVTDVGGFLPAGCMITGQTTGTQGGIGSYTISPAPTAHIAPEAMTASVTLPSGLNKRV